MEYLTVMLGRVSPLGVDKYFHKNNETHAVAAAAARVNYRAAAAESRRRRLAAPLPASIKQCAFQFQRIHASCHRARRNAEMRHLLPNTVC